MEDSPKYSDYRNSVSDLRKIMKEDIPGLRIGKFGIAASSDGLSTLIWNILSDNIVMAISTRSGNIRMRPNSIYFDAIAANRIVTPSDSLTRYRVESRQYRSRWYRDYMLDKNKKTITENADKAGTISLDLGSRDYVSRIEVFNDIYPNTRGKFQKTADAIRQTVETVEIGPTRFVKITVR